ncbi:kinase-like domain-containing protein [Mycena rebaudengoi]|nr:kinase-like domain-containing protein [Mycena rebaudengoi]
MSLSPSSPAPGVSIATDGIQEEEHDSSVHSISYLGSGDLFWCNHRDWLKQKGYTLRARYQADWVPSWKGTNKFSLSCEDGVKYHNYNVMDATRAGDGALVMLKWIDKTTQTVEADIARLFSAEPHRSNPHNRCVPVYEVLETPTDPNIQILVMPFLFRYDRPRFDTFGEVIAFFKQIFEGLKYMHDNNVAHRDCTSRNIMMDGSALASEPFHPVVYTFTRDFKGRVSYRTRTQHPVKYYLTDFGLSRRYKPEERPPLEVPIPGGDKTAPETKPINSSDPPACDPFPTDVYYLGNLIKEQFIQGTEYTSQKLGFEFLEPLANKMTHKIPEERPNMDQVVEEFDRLVDKMSSKKLRSRVAKASEAFPLYYSVPHWMRRLRFVLGRVPAIPMPH